MARDSLYTHPKFRRLVRELGEPAPHVQGHLEALWRVAYKSGDGFIGDAADVEDAAEWDGEPGRFAEAVARHRFVDDLAAGAVPEYHVHDLEDHAPEYVKRRIEREAARRAQGVTLLELKRKAGLASYAKRLAREGAEQTADTCPTPVEQAAGTRPTSGEQTSRPPLSRGEVNREKKERAPRFRPPSIEDVRAHIVEKRYTFTAEAFVAFYESKGWKVGDQPMRSWTAACVTWQGRQGNGAKAPAPARAGLGPAAGPQAPADVVYASEPGSPERRAALEAAGYHTPTDEELAAWKREAEAEIAAAYANRPSSPRDVPSPAAHTPVPATNDPPGPYLPTGLGAVRASEGNVAQKTKESDSLKDDDLEPDWIADVDSLAAEKDGKP